nr:immunoglobulin light chain junction region [Mus musculus]
CQQYWTTPWTF